MIKQVTALECIALTSDGTWKLMKKTGVCVRVRERRKQKSEGTKMTK